MRLTNNLRARINKVLVDHAFGESDKELLKLENDLADQTYNWQFSQKDCNMMESLPSGWLPQRNYMHVNAGGYDLLLSLGRNRNFPHKDLGRKDLTNQALIIHLQTFANKREIHSQEKRKLKGKIQSFLHSITTSNKLFELMPESKPILGDDFFGDANLPSQQIATVGKEIINEITQIRKNN